MNPGDTGGGTDDPVAEIVENEDTGAYYNCPECWWEGPAAPFNLSTLTVQCPECDTKLDTRLKDTVRKLHQ